MARRPAFTLVELLMVIVIIGLVGTIAVPSTVESMRVFRMNASVDAVDHLNRYARAMAVLKHVEAELYFDLEKQEIRLSLNEVPGLAVGDDTVFASSGLVAPVPPEEVVSEEQEENPSLRRQVSSAADLKVRPLEAHIVVEDFEVPEGRVDGDAGFSVRYYPSGQCDGATITLVDTRRPDDRLARILRIDPITGDFTEEYEE